MAQGSSTQAWRSWLRNGLIAFVALGFSAAGFSGLYQGGASPQIDPADIVFASVIGLPAGLVFLRAPFLRVVATPDALVIHGLFRNRTFAWTQIAAVHSKDISRGVVPSVAPVIELAGPGHRMIEATVLASWDFPGERSKRSLGRRSAAGLQEYLRRSRTAARAGG